MSVRVPDVSFSLAKGAVRPWLLPAVNARRTLMAVGLAGALSVAMLLVAGTVVAGVRGWQLAHEPRVPMPSTGPIVSALCAAEGQGPARPDRTAAEPATVLSNMWREAEPDRREEGIHLFTGAIGGAIWQVESENRTRAVFHQQDFEFPFLMNPVWTHVEFAGLFPEGPWRDRQGAWFIRSFREPSPHKAPPYYDTLPTIQLFLPLSDDRTSFDVSRAVRFPLARYASTLVYADRLRVSGGRLEWLNYPTSEYTRRWFVLMPPDDAETSRTSALDMDVSDALGDRRLSLSFRAEPVPGSGREAGQINFAIESIDRNGRTRVLIRRSSAARGGATDVPTDNAVADIPTDAVHVLVSFGGLTRREMVRVVELKLISDDIAPGLKSEFCLGD
jgi:hypothetical protein